LLYKQLKNHLKYLIWQAKVNYVKKLISQAKQNPQSVGELWRGVNNILVHHQNRDSGINAALSLGSINDLVATTSDHHQLLLSLLLCMNGVNRVNLGFIRFLNQLCTLC